MKRIFTLFLTVVLFASHTHRTEGAPPKGYLKAQEVKILLDNFSGRRKKPEIFRVFGRPSSKSSTTYSWRLQDNDALMTFNTTPLLDFLSNLTITQNYDTRGERDKNFKRMIAEFTEILGKPPSESSSRQGSWTIPDERVFIISKPDGNAGTPKLSFTIRDGKARK